MLANETARWDRPGNMIRHAGNAHPEGWCILRVLGNLMAHGWLAAPTTEPCALLRTPVFTAKLFALCPPHGERQRKGNDIYGSTLGQKKNAPQRIDFHSRGIVYER